MTTTAKDFTTTIVVDQTPEEVFAAVNNPRAWWSEEITDRTTQLNDEFNYHYKDVHIAKMKVEELVHNKRVAWRVLNNYFKFTKDTTEWTGTKIVFDITPKSDKTELRFTHEGLVPEYECFEICHDAWTQYIKESLRKLIETGKGEPSQKESEFNDGLLEKN